MNYIVLDLEWNQGNEQVEKQRKDVPFEIIEIGAVKLNDRLELCHHMPDILETGDGQMQTPGLRRAVCDESSGRAGGGTDDRTDGAERVAPGGESFAACEVFHEIVRPQIYHEMHRTTRDMLHLDMEDLREGASFPEVMERFLRWCASSPEGTALSAAEEKAMHEQAAGSWMFATWAPQDLTELQRNMRYYQMPPLGDNPVRFYDVQKLFSIAFEDGKSRRSLKYAVEFLRLPEERAFHRALSDAFYTAQILERIRDPQILQKVSFDSFRIPQNRKEEVHIVFDDYAKYISREFEDKEKLFRDREVVSTKCYLCHRNLRKKVKWFTPNGRHYYSISLCGEHGYMKGKIRVKKTETGGVYAVKTLKFISEEEAAELLQKKGKTGEKQTASS